MNLTSSGPAALKSFGGLDDLHALIDTVPDAMIVIDTTGQILSFSNGAERMFGYAETELIGENVSVLMPSPDRERHDSYLEHYIETSERRIIGIGRVTTARARDGATFPIDLSVGEVNLNERKAFVGFIRDLTDSKETEQQLHSLQADLAHVSRISSMGMMATSIAHELNQPLTAITNYTEAARDLLDEPNEESIAHVREALNECAAEAIRAGQIVQRLRSFISRGETTREIVSLARVVKEATALALINGDARDVDFEVMLDDADDRVLADPVQIQQVLVNLIRNALEAMDESTVKKLVISSHNNDDNMLTVTISDSGPGLDQHVAEHLFHPFISTKASGMGLGLSICNTIINAHNGKIWAEPSPLGGTDFHFTLISAKGDTNNG
ncbi:PAS domain-containing sensor histidine kinase [Altererythrobacter sp. ZODW24]|uniref:PAS domain-containing sensor histidine kinase n=1 Tax=Altererythrobacter sp. ZODW24 TaxID=2185142 RepID=UPI0013B462DB|nr:PAS domain-containing sensor histidine kinase [Altererythrobacter sp. ZODW24]